MSLTMSLFYTGVVLFGSDRFLKNFTDPVYVIPNFQKWIPKIRCLYL